MKKSKLIAMIVDIIAIIVLVFIDQYTKVLAVAKLKGNNPHVLIDGVLEFRYLENRGAAFGMLQDKKTLFVFMTIVMFRPSSLKISSACFFTTLSILIFNFIVFIHYASILLHYGVCFLFLDIMPLQYV